MRMYLRAEIQGCKRSYVEIRKARPMTAARRTLEEIAQRDADAETNGLKVSQRFDDFPDILAIAQGQREELERLRANASTAAFDKINDQLREANRENEELRGLLGNAGQADIERQYCNCNP